jgi:zinc protease
VRDGFSDAEIETAKSGLLQARMQARAQDEIVANAWTDKLHRGTTWAEAADYDARLQALTRAEVHAALKKHLDVSRVSVVRAGSFAATQ